LNQAIRQRQPIRPRRLEAGPCWQSNSISWRPLMKMKGSKAAFSRRLLFSAVPFRLPLTDGSTTHNLCALPSGRMTTVNEPFSLNLNTPRANRITPGILRARHLNQRRLRDHIPLGRRCAFPLAAAIRSSHFTDRSAAL